MAGVTKLLLELMAGLRRCEVIRLLESTTGCRPSDTILRRVQQELDRQVARFKEREITDRRASGGLRRSSQGRCQRRAAALAIALDPQIPSSGCQCPGGCRELAGFLRLPTYVRTTNPIERVFRELRRQQFGCGAFANRNACNRAVYRVFAWLNELWFQNDIWQPRIRKRKQLPTAA